MFTTTHLLKALHVIAMVCWFAGLFYLPRLFVYHAESTRASQKTLFKTMEHRLFYYIMTPAALATIALGVMLWWSAESHYLTTIWFRTKLVLVALLIGYHLISGYFLLRLKQDRSHQNGKFFRYFNEIPTLLLITIILFTYLKPFS